MRMLSLRAAAACLIALVSACSSTKPTASGGTLTVPGASSRGSASAGVADQCKSNRKKCLYEGSYESGERDYAEQEAKRLNLAELERLRRVFGN
ncbi:Lipoprotein [Bordetella flabilis]